MVATRTTPQDLLPRVFTSKHLFFSSIFFSYSLLFICCLPTRNSLSTEEVEREKEKENKRKNTVLAVKQMEALAETQFSLFFNSFPLCLSSGTWQCLEAPQLLRLKWRPFLLVACFSRAEGSVNRATIGFRQFQVSLLLQFLSHFQVKAAAAAAAAAVFSPTGRDGFANFLPSSAEEMGVGSWVSAIT